jgi:hypothetical protein
MRSAALLAVFSCLAAAPALADQPFESDKAGESAFRFATFYAGVEAEGLQGGLQPLGPDTQGLLAPSFVPRLTLGGTHFWGHADLYLSLPLAGIPLGTSTRASAYGPGAQVGGRVYPVRLKTNELRGFLGGSWTPFTYTQQGADGSRGATLRFDRLALEVGGSYLLPLGLVEAGVRMILPERSRYHYSRDDSGPLSLPVFSAFVGFKYLFDTSIENEQEAGSGRTARRLAQLEKLRPWSHLGLAAGVSTSYALTASSWNQRQYRFLADRPSPSLNPDLALSVNLPELNALLNLSWRPITQVTSAFGLEQTATRNVVAAELAFRLGNFHGFVPFAGAFASLEMLGVRETDAGAELRAVQQTKGGYGAVFGWDILPTGAEWLVLRSNLRYTVGVGADMPGRTQVWFDHLEVNFLQVVLYPARLLGRPDSP